MIHTSREGLGYYFVEVTGSNGRHYLIQAYGEEAKGLQKEVRSQEQDWKLTPTNSDIAYSKVVTSLWIMFNFTYAAV